MSDPNKPLTLKQRRFVDAYLITANCTEAARRAGYKGTNGVLSVVGQDNLRKPIIAKAVEDRLRESTAKSKIQIVDVYEEFTEQLQFAKKTPHR